MTQRTISISGAAYDGYSCPQMLGSIARLGVSYVELAFIAGYTEAFDETAFKHSNARLYIQWLEESSIRCHALSAHMDLGRSSSVDIFRHRMDFARTIGARLINTNAAASKDASAFRRNMDQLSKHAEHIGIIIGLENPGDGSDNVFNVAADGAALIRDLNQSHIRLNYDLGNLVSHRPAHSCTAEELLEALPFCEQLHLKDVRGTAKGWEFTSIGAGYVDFSVASRALAEFPTLALSIEIPLRLIRDRHGRPSRSLTRVPLAHIETTLRTSLEYLSAMRILDATAEVERSVKCC